MDFLLDDDNDISNMTIEQFIRPEIIAFEINRCCGKDMIAINHNGIRKYECAECGKYIMTQESFDNKTEIIVNYELPVNTYGSLSGHVYMRKMKDDLKTFMNQLTPHYKLSETQVIKIMESYFAMRNSNIRRAEPRRGVICACIHQITKIPVDYLSKFFNLNQRYITEGQKSYNRKLSPFVNVTVDDMVDEVFKRIEYHKDKKICEIRDIIVELVKLSLAYYIAVDTTVKTKVAGILLYLIDVGYIVGYDIEFICKILDIGKNTIYKFYDQFIIMLHVTSRVDGMFIENYHWCNKQLRDYFNTRGVPIIDIPTKKRIDKYRAIYIF